MQLTEQQLAELERRVQRVKRLSNSYQPVYDTCVPSREWAQAVTEALEALASALQGEGGGEAVSERWKLGWLESYNAYTGEPERFVYRPGDDEHTRICVRGENCDEDARRIVASVNACLGIPTETLKAGEVVPLALVDSIIREVLTNEEKYVPAAMLGNQGLNAYHGIMREIRNALSRLQQNGGEG